MDVIEFLIERRLLLVHFAGAEGAEPAHKQFPKNLLHALKSKCDICCSTIDANERSTWGQVGLIIKPANISAVKGVAPEDMGSILELDGTITVPPKYETVDRETCSASVDQRADMNEWIITGDYGVLGVYVCDIASNNVALLDVISLSFPEPPIYTARAPAFTKCDGGLSAHKASVREIYSLPPQ